MKMHFLFIHHENDCSSLPPLKCECLPLPFPLGEKLLCIRFTPLPFWFMCKFRASKETRQKLLETLARLAARDQCWLPKLTERLP